MVVLYRSSLSLSLLFLLLLLLFLLLLLSFSLLLSSVPRKKGNCHTVEFMMNLGFWIRVVDADGLALHESAMELGSLDGG